MIANSCQSVGRRKVFEILHTTFQLSDAGMMARIVIYLDKTANRAEVVLRLQRATGRSLNDIRTAMLTNLPIVEMELYEGDFASHAALLRSVVTCIEDFSLKSRIYELPEGTTLEACEFADKCEIGPSILLNILQSDEGEAERRH